MERHVFSIVENRVRTVASHMITLPVAGTNRRTATSNSTVDYADQHGGGMVCLFYLSLDIRLGVWRKFHFYVCNVNYSTRTINIIFEAMVTGLLGSTLPKS